jgi:hypothetical protein
VDQGAKVTVVAHGQAALAAVQQRLGVAVIPADVTDDGAAQRILASVRPEVLVLNAGATPRMGPLDQLSWVTSPRRGRPTEGRPLLDAGRPQPSARAGRPRPRGLQRRGAAGLAALGRIRWRQAHALVHGQVRRWRC